MNDEPIEDFDAFYERTAPDVARHIYLLTASPHRAAHVTHQAYAKAYTDWDTVSRMPSPLAWIRMAASDLALDHVRRGLQKVGGWIPHPDRLATKVRREPATPAPARDDEPTPPEAVDIEDIENVEPEAPEPEPADADLEAHDAEPEDHPKPVRDNRSKKKGRKQRTSRQAPAPEPDATAPEPEAEQPERPGEPEGPEEPEPLAPLTPLPLPLPLPVPDLSDEPLDAPGDLTWKADVALLRALRRLPAHRRRAVVLHHQLGLSAEEIAAETEATTAATRDRIALGNAQLARKVGELTGPNPDGPEAHERLGAVLNDLTGRYEPKLHSPRTVRNGARTRTGVLVAVVAVVVLGLAGLALSAMTTSGLPNKRAEVQASMSAREAAGIRIVVTPPPAPFKFGRTNAKAERIPDERRELVYVQGTVDRDGGTFLTVKTARDADGTGGTDGVPDVRDVPLAPIVSVRGAQAFGLPEPKSVTPQDFLAALADGKLTNTAFDLHFNMDDQVDRINEYVR
ncbi:RNA polymerase sigma factor [Yinghuangia seranimata]|uniref:RNA polymerase sigma factor n=1 Tax=Yinghuangia seranimata TaxID=408067 RepID=UPI00248D14AF|nr:sigma factor-like helix-turn-helix DNA-binding protein [Yinghuangia seranimata]MDI2126781.1 sigma factor-like helix-turn-helix DNA-binding protein [Yinghuangia seranimata]